MKYYNDSLTLYQNILCTGYILKAKLNRIISMKRLKQSLRSSEELGDKKQIMTTLNRISYIHVQQGNYAAALERLEQSLRISQELGERKREWRTLNCMISLHGALGNHEAVLRCREQILSKADKKLGLNGVSVELQDMLWNSDVEQWKSHMRLQAEFWGRDLSMML
uniref:tetratricopeptide repeat protein n=1 Tax=Candidatus Electronema sp. TaxID=2698783 RepID=UPI004057388D